MSLALLAKQGDTMITLFLIGYIVIALVCVGFGLYLSEPGHTWSTLKDDVLNLLPGRSRPAPIDPWSVQHDEQPAPIKDEPKRPSFFEELQHNADTQCHRVTPPVAPVSDESHEEAAPVEVVHDEP